MCKICNVEQGNCEVLANDFVEVTIGKRKMTEHLLGFYIGRDMDGSYSLETSYFIDGGNPVAMTKVPIQYCPCCGRKLTRT